MQLLSYTSKRIEDIPRAIQRNNRLSIHFDYDDASHKYQSQYSSNCDFV